MYRSLALFFLVFSSFSNSVASATTNTETSDISANSSNNTANIIGSNSSSPPENVTIANSNISDVSSVTTGEDDETILIKLYPNGEDGGQGLWITKRVHFPDIQTFERLMQSYVENGVSNGGYNRPLEFACKVYRYNGQVITKWQDLYEGDSLYVVPFDTIFMWPGVRIGHKVNVSKTLLTPEEQHMDIELETLSISPRIFRMRSLITEQECKDLIELNRHNMTRSAVGKVDNYDQTTSPKTNRRTSTNNFDVSSTAARAIINRIFSLLRIQGRDAIEDGLQIVRYAQNEAYDVHTDFFPLGYSPEIGMNFDPVTGGSNRYATVFAFLTDDFQGGQTVFPHVSKSGEGTCTPVDRNVNHEDENWTHIMTNGMCSNSLAITPKTGDAVLFYSAKTSGKMDPLTEHGGCPVINGTKFGANLWIWNRGKYGSRTQYETTFVNELSVPAHVYFFNPQQNPPLVPMAEIPPHKTATFLASKGDQFVAHSGTEWVGKYILEESHHKHRAFRIGSPKIDIMNSFEYHIGFGAGVRVGQEYAAQQQRLASGGAQQGAAAIETAPQTQQVAPGEVARQAPRSAEATETVAPGGEAPKSTEATEEITSSESARETSKSAEATEKVAA